jgi:hypothetical protein
MKLTDEQIARLRQSGIRLDPEGRFWHGGGEVTHPGLRAALWRWLDRDPDGRYVLRLDADRFVYVDVDDAPFLIRSIRWDGDRAFALLSDGSEEELAYATLRLSPTGVPYATVKGRFDARLATAAWSGLEPRLVEQDGAARLEAAGGPYPVLVHRG